MRAAIPLCLFLILPIAALAIALERPRTALTPRVGTNVTDMMGRQVALPVPAQHVAMFPPMLWHFLTLDRGPARAMAAAHYQIEEVSNGLLSKVYPGATQIAVAATEGNTAVPAGAEQLLTMKPDVVFAWAWFSDALMAAGLPVVQMTYDSKNYRQGELDWWRTIAAVTGQRRRGEELLDRSARHTAAIVHDLPVIEDARKPRAAYLFVNGLGDMRLLVPNSMFGEAMTIAGAANAGGDGAYGKIDLEQLLRMNPDVIFLEPFWEARISPQDLYEAPALTSLSAIRHRRVYLLPRGGSRMDNVIEWPLLERWMAELLYPEQMPRKLRQEFRETYRAVYGYALSDADIDETLHFRENGGSAGYDRFK